MSEAIDLHVKNNLLHLDATEIADLIKSKYISSKEVTTILIEHIKHVNKELNAVVEERFDAALQEAIEMDEMLDQIDLDDKPLYGVPISVKESLHVKGMKTTGGVYHRKDLIMSHDAETVTKVKQAGAIVLCKTNTPTLCFCHETDNKLYGRTNNAWDKTRTAGGSSGGEGALIAVGGTPIGLSSDIGGSIRFPSHFNGVVGFKPGKFQVSSKGHFPPDTIPLKTRMSGVGPIGKSIRDVELMYQIIGLTLEQKNYYKKVEVDILPPDIDLPLSDATATVLNEIYESLQSIYETNFSIPPYFHDSAAVWQEIMSIDGGQEVKDLAFNVDRVNLWKYYTKEKLLKNTNVHAYLSWALIGANMFKPSTKRIKEIESFIEEGDRLVQRHLANRLLISPVYHDSALKHGELYKEIFSIKKTYRQFMPYIAYANVWGLPSLTIPIQFDDENLPIGIQIMGNVGNEKAIFTLGKVLENKFGGYIRSTAYD